jgi:hypothetical protein
MAKYYLQSGTVRLVIDAEDQERATLWFIHRSLEALTSLYEDDTLDPHRKLDTVMIESMLDLDELIQISEQGFDRNDSETRDTLDTVLYWHQLMIALSRLG